MKHLTGFAALALALCVAGCGDDKAATDAAAPSTAEPIAPIAAPAGSSWTETVTKTEDGAYVLGNPDAPIRLVEYASLTCSHCAEFAETAFASIRDDYVASGRVAYELHNFVRDPIDLTAAMLTRCGPDTSYFALSEQVLANQAAIFEKAQALGQARYEQILNLPEGQRYTAFADALGLIDFFAQRGVSRDQAQQCLAQAETARAMVDATGKAGEELNIQGTPTFFLNSRPVTFTNWAALENEIQQMGAR